MKAAPDYQPFSRADRSFLGAWWWTVDHGLLLAVFLLSVVGLAMVSTASPPVAMDLKLEEYYFLKRQFALLLPAMLVMLGVSMLAPRTIWRMCSIVFLLGIGAMILTLFVGEETKGARRWLPLLGMSLQPSEFVKPAFIVVAAWFMSLQKTPWGRIGASSRPILAKAFAPKDKAPMRNFTIVVVLYAFVILLLMLQPDLGMSVVVTSVLAVQIFLAGMRLRYLAIMLLIAPVALGGAYFAHEHVRSRIDSFLFDESGGNYQVKQSLAAFRNGGLTGTGPGQGTVKYDLPDAHADFIFPVAGEEFGIVFVFFLMGLFLFVILRGFGRLRQSQDVFSVLAVGGLLTMFGLQALIHMGSSVHLLPTKGMTMPFISYGGSSLLSLGLAMGIILSLTRRQGGIRTPRPLNYRPSSRTDGIVHRKEPRESEE
ncbi:MAG: cell division protein FtsW [Alphaproteobacteria bacterium]|nr:cell division protein FtsW [Alphaproteobacteria bacterium]MCB9974287.1 cell division protein FtsW [Rhodospirillales bacterium]